MAKLLEVRVLETPIKSEGDKKDYRLIQLPNGLTALLIKENTEGKTSSDDIAAVSLTVKVGSFDDPPSAMGLAHFLEHILFMGSEKYPGENTYNDFLVANGGADNAMTTAEYTAYFFKVSEVVFPEALDIFAQQFVAPLLLKDSMQRERESVDSEYQMAMTNDFIHIEQIYKRLIFETHSASQNSCGNLKTLRDDITDDDLHRELLQLFKKYTGNKMNLAMQSKRTLDEMQELVVQNFSSIKTAAAAEVHSLPPKIEEIFKPEFSTKIHHVKPKTATKLLLLTWALPSMHPHYKCDPMSYISSIFDNDGEGGIADYLKQKQLITTVLFYPSSYNFSDNSQFSLPRLLVQLTDLGFEKINKVLEACFAYLLMLKETSIEEHRRFYNEIKEKNDTEFKFYKESGAMSNVRNAITPMIFYEPIDILRGKSLYQAFDEQLIVDIINALNQRNFNIMFLNNERETYSEKEPHFGAEYDELDFPEEYQKLWDERTSNPDFFLEKPNPFKATNFEIFVNEEESPKYPVKILEDNIYEVWHKLDNKFNIPKASVKIQMSSPNQITSTQNLLYLKIYDTMLTQHLNMKFSQATSAGFDFYPNIEDKAFILEFNGYNEKINTLVDMIVKEQIKFNDNLDQEMFETQKASMKKRYFNSLLNSGTLNRECLDDLLIENDLELSYKFLKEFEIVSLENLQKFISKFFQKLKIKVLIQGNMRTSDALELVKILQTNVACEANDGECRPKDRIYQVPLGTTVERVKSLMLNDDNSRINNVYQFGPGTLRTRSIMHLIADILDPKAFDYLRNREQLGYSVSCGFHENEGIIGLKTFVSSQEHKHAYQKVYQKIEYFMNEIAKKAIEDLPDAEFETFKEARYKSLSADHKQLSQELSRNWKEIRDCEYVFDRFELAAKATKGLTKLDLQDFYKSFTQPENTRKLSIQVIGNEKSDDESGSHVKDRELNIELMTEKLTENENLITDIDEFKNGLMLFPEVKFQIE